MKKIELPPRPRKVSRLPQCNKSNRLMRRYRHGHRQVFVPLYIPYAPATD